MQPGLDIEAHGKEVSNGIEEACQVWIEQRVEEELEGGKSYRAIGRELAKEIERIFQGL